MTETDAFCIGFICGPPALMTLAGCYFCLKFSDRRLSPAVKHAAAWSFALLWPVTLPLALIFLCVVVIIECWPKEE